MQSSGAIASPPPTGDSCAPPECLYFDPAVEAPHAHCVVVRIAARDDLLAIGEAGDAVDGAIVGVCQGVQQLARGSTPHLGRAVLAARDNAHTATLHTLSEWPANVRAKSEAREGGAQDSG